MNRYLAMMTAALLLAFQVPAEDDCRGDGCGPVELENHVIVQELADFPAPVDGVITPEESTKYEINTFVNMGTNRFDCGANDLNIVGTLNTLDGLLYLGTGTFITCTNGISTKDVGLISAGSGKLLSYSGDNSEDVVFRATTVSGFPDLGEANEFRSFATLLSQFVNFGEGFAFAGSSNRAVFLDESTFIPSSNLGPVIDLGTATMRTFSAEGGRIETFAAGQSGIEGLASSANIDDQANVTGVIFDGPGNHLVGVTNADIKWDFQLNSGNGGTENSQNLAAMTLQGNTDETVISTINTPVKVVGTWVCGDLSRFTCDTSGMATYIGIPDKQVQVSSSFVAQSATGTNIDYTFYIAVNDGVLTDFGSQRSLGSSAFLSTTLLALVELSTGDELELYVENNDGTVNAIFKSASYLTVGFN